MGRPRSVRSDLPDGLYFDADRQTFRIRTGLVKRSLGRVTRAQAIETWVKLVGKPREATPAAPGSFAALLADWLEQGLALVGGERTRKEYERRAPHLRARWGAHQVARTEAEAARGGYLTAGVFTSYLDGFRLAGNVAAPKGVQANRDVRLASTVFSWAKSRGRLFFHPVEGVHFLTERERRVTIPDEALALILAHARPTLRAMVRLDRLIGVRVGDVRLLKRAQVGPEGVTITSAKTGVATHFDRTPALDAVLAECTALSGTVRSLAWMFVTRTGKPLTISQVSRQWSRARAAAIEANPGRQDLAGYDFRDVRKTAINRVHASGANATDFAGHLDESTTRRHYLVEPKRVKPAP